VSDQAVVKQLGLGKEQVEELVKGLESRLGQLDERLDRLESKLDTAVEGFLDTVGDKLPEQAGAFLGQAHEVAKAARKQVRGLLVSAA
jgi:ABC-type transporter Mla subunit MlaD